ncbi:hypothetical protein N7495_000771 [Penicillium taxi]|uniref:uncharacterized protein n=1 Tax=Penicillium taxi TaxID=168475 RepID=UPI0025458F1B|nr:uncharacterized protein N7495_000771 [Penicillium taxi]KAJ5908089.1 hypothetical protein N7495_000771 [Penicillium taxi]
MEWDPSRFFRASGSPFPYALLVLNQPINEKAVGVLSEYASYIICADGGANRLHDMLKKEGKESSELPDIIIGDLDSIRPDVYRHYENLGVTLLRDPDQYSTDFTKCLKYLNTHATEIVASPRQSRKFAEKLQDAPLEVVILGGLGGRVDQAFSQVHHLYMMSQTQRELREASESDEDLGDNNQNAGGNLYLVSEESVTFVLQRGKNTICTPATRRADVEEQGQEVEYFFEENIGIIPLSAPASITTHGFEWDVEDWHTEIGGQISTSNHIRADRVEVETSVPVLFTVELAERLKRR